MIDDLALMSAKRAVGIGRFDGDDVESVPAVVDAFRLDDARRFRLAQAATAS
jgi:hypothetical protein